MAFFTGHFGEFSIIAPLAKFNFFDLIGGSFRKVVSLGPAFALEAFALKAFALEVALGLVTSVDEIRSNWGGRIANSSGWNVRRIGRARRHGSE